MIEGYTIVKAIKVEPMTKGEYNKYKGWTIPENENPKDIGILIKYSNGDENWFSADAYEKQCMTINEDDNTLAHDDEENDISGSEIKIMCNKGITITQDSKYNFSNGRIYQIVKSAKETLDKVLQSLGNNEKKDLPIRERYIGVKIIKAEPMTRGEYNKYKGWTIPKNENPDDPGYLVEYSDSYESWSPVDVFETYYKAIGNNDVNQLVDDELVDKFIKKIEVDSNLVYVECVNGYIMSRSSTSDFTEKEQREIVDEYKSKIMSMITFLIYSGSNGFNNN